MTYLPADKFFMENKPLESVIVPAEILESFTLADSTGLPADNTLPLIEAVCEDALTIKKLKKEARVIFSKRDFIMICFAHKDIIVRRL